MSPTQFAKLILQITEQRGTVSFTVNRPPEIKGEPLRARKMSYVDVRAGGHEWRSPIMDSFHPSAEERLQANYEAMCRGLEKLAEKAA